MIILDLYKTYSFDLEVQLMRAGFQFTSSFSLNHKGISLPADSESSELPITLRPGKTHKSPLIQGLLLTMDGETSSGSMERTSGWLETSVLVCTVWQYGLWSFQMGDTKFERFLSKNQHTHSKLLNY